MEIIDNYLQLPRGDRLLFQLGRKGGALRSVEEFKDPRVKDKLLNAARSLEEQRGEDLENILPELSREHL